MESVTRSFASLHARKGSLLSHASKTIQYGQFVAQFDTNIGTVLKICK